jgi:outer membrane lipoprotein-sorting protein
MSLFRSWRAYATLAAAVGIVPAAVTRDEVMSRMDAAGAKFRDMSAQVKQVSYTPVIKDTSEQSGTVQMMKVAPGEIKGLVEFTNPDHKYYLFEKRTLKTYTPNIDTVQIIDLGQHGEELDQFLSIGFGTTGKELAKSYKVEVASDNTVAGTTLVRLTPLSADVKKYLTHIDLWLSDQSYPVQEKLWEPSGDTVTVYYTDVRINRPIPAGSFRLPVKPTTKTEYPQK